LWFAPGESLAQGWYYCTLLRDPVERFISQYWFNRNAAMQSGADAQNQHLQKDPQVLAAHHCNLEEYLRLQATAIVRSYTNVQSAHFAQRFARFRTTCPKRNCLKGPWQA